MKTKSSTPHVLLPLVGLVLITGLVHASADESPIDGVFLRPQLSPYATPHKEIVSLRGQFVSDVVHNQDTLLEKTQSEEQSTGNEELPFMDLLSQAFTSKPQTDGSIFTNLTLKAKDKDTDDTTTMISNIHVKTNSSSSVTIMWDLNKFADVTVYYDTKEVVTETTSTPSVKISAFRFANEATLEGLKADTTYHYLLVVDNHFSKATTLSSGSFRTAP